MRRYHLPVLAVVLIGPVVCLLAADPPADKKPDAEQLVRDLGSPVYTVRDKASRELWKLGEPARAAVEAATKSEDPEVAQRAANILEKFDWGIFPDTPADVLSQIKEFRSDELPRQVAAVGALLRQGDRGIKTLRLVLAHDFDADPRQAFFEEVLITTREIVPGLLFAGKLDEAARVLALGTSGPNPESWLDYAVFAVQHGRVPEATRHLDAAGRGTTEASRAARLAKVVLLVVSGQPAAGRDGVRAADKPPDDLLPSVLAEAGAWGPLADADEPAGASHQGLRLFCARKAGKTELAAELLTSLKRTTAVGLGSDDFEEAGVALFLNAQPLDAMTVLRETKARPRLLADVLGERLLFTDALGLLADGPASGDADDDRPRLYYEMRHARILAKLGRKDEAVQKFNKLGEQVRDGSPYVLREFLRASLRSGYLDLSAEHAGQFVARVERRGNDAFTAQPDPFELLFDEDAEAAKAIWRAFRHDGERREGNPAEAMRRVRDLLTGRAEPARLGSARKLLDQWQGANAKPDGAVVERTRTHQALAALARLAGDAAGTEAELRKAVREWAYDDADKPRSAAAVRDLPTGTDRGPRAWMYDTNESFKVWLDLGQFLLDRARPADAAKAFEQGWRQYPNNPILLFLSGKALRAAGDAAEGDRRVKLSHAVALGDAQQRGRFLHELTERGELTDMTAEGEWTKKCVWYRTPYRGNVWNVLARAAEVTGDFEGAAAATERNLHFLLQTPNITFCDGGGYVRVPAGIRGYRARAALAAGKPAEAFAAAKDVLQLLPGQVEFLAGIVPEFDKRKHTAEGQALFDVTWAAMQKLVRENPGSAWARATAAQAGAGCGRELDTALEYAKKAVELAPDLRWHHEVLAECHFRKNDRAAALKVMDGLRKLDPRSPYYRRLTERYQAADITSPALLAPEVD